MQNIYECGKTTGMAPLIKNCLIQISDSKDKLNRIFKRMGNGKSGELSMI